MARLYQPTSSSRLGTSIRRLRLARGWPIGALAGRAGLPRWRIQYVETCTNARLSPAELVAIAGALDITVEDLLHAAAGEGVDA